MLPVTPNETDFVTAWCTCELRRVKLQGGTYSHGRYDDQRVQLRYLGSCSQHRIHVSAIHCMAGVGIGEEDTGDFALLSQLGDVDVIFQGVLGVRIIPRPSPLAGALVIPATCRLKQVEVYLFLFTSHGTHVYFGVSGVSEWCTAALLGVV